MTAGVPVTPRLLDSFCGAGGAAMGYHRAGFEVVGVDINPQPHYPFEMVEWDALEYLRAIDPTEWNAVHASPPCQFGTAYKRRPNHVKDSPNLIAETRELLAATGLPYIIEQPYVNREHLKNPVMLCGSMFGLDVQRHRVFEANFDLPQPACDHTVWTPGFPAATNRRPMSRRTVEVGVWRIPFDVQKRAMGVDWDCTLPELSEMIPPAYTEFLGAQLLAAGVPVNRP